MLNARSRRATQGRVVRAGYTSAGVDFALFTRYYVLWPKSTPLCVGSVP